VCLIFTANLIFSQLWSLKRSSVCGGGAPLSQPAQMSPLSVHIPSDPTLPIPLGLPVSPLLTRAPPGGTTSRRRSVSTHHHHINYYPSRSARSSLSSYHSPPRSLRWVVGFSIPVPESDVPSKLWAPEDFFPGWVKIHSTRSHKCHAYCLIESKVQRSQPASGNPRDTHIKQASS